MALWMEAGLSLERRRELRALISEHEHELADKRARESGLTLRCLRSGDRAEEHARCRGEAPGGCGCLCECHDAAAATVIEQDTA